MNSLPQISEKIKHPLLKIKVLVTMLVILTASIWFALASQPVQPVRVVTPDLIIMGRESEPTRSILVNLANGQTLVWEVA